MTMSRVGLQEVVQAKKHRLLLLSLLGVAVIFLILITSLSLGPVNVEWQDILSVLLNVGSTTFDGEKDIILNIRLPRAIEAISIGASLSIAGAVMQTLVRNPMADPFILGVSSGAALGAISVFTTDIPFGLLLLPICAFIGGIIAFSITLILSRLAGATPIAVILSGIAVSTAFSSIVTLLLFLNPERSHMGILWLFGSLSLSSWQEVRMILPCSIFGIALALLRARTLNVMLMGEEQAQQLGVNVDRLKCEMMILSAFLTGVSVSFTGIIGFIGLVCPHISRMIVGGDHRLLLPASIISGSIILSLADLAARVVAMPLELPLGALTAVIGVPFFVYLLIKSRGKYEI